MKMRKLLSMFICISVVAMLFIPALGVVTANAADGKTVYVSSTGSDENDGSEAAPFATLQKAWTNSDTGKLTIVIVDNVVLDVSTVAFTFGSENKASETVIKGATASSLLDLSAKTRMGLYGGGSKFTFDNITLKFDQTLSSNVPTAKFYANGRHVVITETVTFADNAPINIFAGGNGIEVASTRLEVYGGYYYYIYGGGENYPVTGDVNLTVGGNINAGENIDDESSNVAQARIYGGGYKGAVGGDVNINYGGNAIARVLTGTGRESGEVGGSININMTGGKVSTISATKTVHDKDADVHISMTGGLCEAIFGGGESTSITGNTVVYVGGTADVSRRIHGGCYNESTSSGTSRVIGSATVIIDSGCKLASGTGLSWMNSFYMAINAGSRLSTDPADEFSTLVFLNDTYSTYSSKMSSSFKQDYVVKVGKGGTVDSAMNGTAALTMLPDEGKAAVIGTEKLASGQTYALSAATTEITFADAVYNTVTLDHNNGTGSSSTFEKLDGGYAVIPEVTVTNGDKELLGWSTAANATVAEYVAGDKYTADGDTTLYAVWRGRPQTYSVMHMLFHGDDAVFYKGEKLNGYVGSMTEAKTLELLGYKAFVSQEILVKNETTVVIVSYEPDGSAIGDVNCDGAVDMLDAALLLRRVAAWPGYDDTNTCIYTSDLNGDGVVDVLDTVLLKKQLVGIE